MAGTSNPNDYFLSRPAYRQRDHQGGHAGPQGVRGQRHVVHQPQRERARTGYSVNGTCHYNATASGNITIANLPAGIYIVKAGDETMKISVR